MFFPLREPLDTRYAQLMQLSDEQVKDFIDAWKADFGETLTVEDARAEALRLLDFFGQFSEGLERIRKQARDTVSANHIE